MKDPLDDLSIEVRQVVAGIAVFAAAAVALVVVNPTLAGTIGVLLFFFVFMIGLHELGHFVMAKRAGMKVTEFFIGFGPRLWSVQRGETEYGIKAIPLGGYCKIIGMTNLDDIDPADEPRAYRSKGWWGKVSTVVAGPVTHFALAILLVYVVLVGAGDYSERETTTTIDRVSTEILRHDAAGEVVERIEGPAYAAGLRTGDRVLAVDGDAIADWDEMVEIFETSPGATLAVEVDRGGARRTFDVELLTAYLDPVTGEKVLDEPEGATKVGFAGLEPDIFVPSVSAFDALGLAPARTLAYTGDTIGGLGHIFSPAGLGEYLDNFGSDGDSGGNQTRFVSPIGFGKVANDAVRAGWVSVFSLLIAINLFVGLLNLLPLLPFDGGHIAVASYEAIASRVRGRRVRVDFAKLVPVMVATLSILAFIFLSSLFLDLANPADSPF